MGRGVVSAIGAWELLDTLLSSGPPASEVAVPRMGDCRRGHPELGWLPSEPAAGCSVPAHPHYSFSSSAPPLAARNFFFRQIVQGGWTVCV